MALITCLDCSKDISSLAKACPQCGRPVKVEQRTDITLCWKPGICEINLGFEDAFSISLRALEVMKPYWEPSVNILVQKGQIHFRSKTSQGFFYTTTNECLLEVIEIDENNSLFQYSYFPDTTEVQFADSMWSDFSSALSSMIKPSV